MKYLHYLILLIVAAALAMISFGVFSFFGFVNFGFWRKLHFFGVLLVQMYVPMVCLWVIYTISNKAEARYYDEMKKKTEFADHADKPK
jgi:uncharacterized membrane protein